MQRNGCKLNETHINTIALKARLDNRECGYLWKRSTDSPGSKWQIKWFALYQNFLFYYENVNSTKPLGLILLESCYCNRIVANTKNTKEGEIKLYCFSISFTKDGKNPIEFGAESEEECIQWIESIQNCSYNKLASQIAEMQQKYIHLNQMYETESKSKWTYLAQIEELSNEVKTLREELRRHEKKHYLLRSKTIADEEVDDIKRLKKVQSLCRGWLYRRRWKRIVRDYIESPHAANLRKRNRLVFELVEKEGEYMSQLEVLVSNFLRPFKMAACSSKPPITHEEVNSIFLNSEILLFLHQIFYKGLQKKLDNWPTLFVGDLFDFLLPVLVVYQEYVRNHHYSLQILTDMKSKSFEFRNLLKRCEDKSKCEGRSLDVFLTYPMHQIPRYILILHQLISVTSHYSVNELKSLEDAKTKLEELSKTMHDEVSETENIRTNLAIEKMIIEGCDVILDANQVFIREGLLILLIPLKNKSLTSKVKEIKKKQVVKCFLFTNHLIVTTRASNGRLNLFKPYDAIPLKNCKIIEDITNDLGFIEEENSSQLSDESSVVSSSVVSSESSLFYSNKDHSSDYSCEFRVVQSDESSSRIIQFICSSMSEKQSWCSDISQCVENLNYSTVLQNTATSAAVNMPNTAVHVEDPKLFQDEKNIKYSKSLNSCKVPQIRYATVEKLMERLTDLRFLSIDFLNTFLLTYRVFMEPLAIIEALRALYESSPKHSQEFEGDPQPFAVPIINELSRKISVAGIFRLPSINEEQLPLSFPIKRNENIDHTGHNGHHHRRDSSDDSFIPSRDRSTSPYTKMNDQNGTGGRIGLDLPRHSLSNNFNSLRINKLEPIASCETINNQSNSSSTPTNSNGGSTTHTATPSPNATNSTDLKHDFEEIKSPTAKKPACSSVSSDVTISSPYSRRTSGLIENVLNNVTKANVSDGIISPKMSVHKFPHSSCPIGSSFMSNTSDSFNTSTNSESKDEDDDNISDDEDKCLRDKFNNRVYNRVDGNGKSNISLNGSISSATSGASRFGFWAESLQKYKTPISFMNRLSANAEALALSPGTVPKRASVVSASKLTPTPSTSSSTTQFLSSVQQNAQKIGKRLSDVLKVPGKLPLDANHKKIPINVYAGVVVTSSRSSRRRISSSEATKAFAVATSGSSSETTPLSSARQSVDINGMTGSKNLFNVNHRYGRANSAFPAVHFQKGSHFAIVNTAASMRVLNILRHWITKYSLDFSENNKLKDEALNLVYDIVGDPQLTETEKKVARGIIQQLNLLHEKTAENSRNIEILLMPPSVAGKVKFNDLSVSEIAEQMTYIDYQIFCSISSQELLGQAWMKPSKQKNAKNVLIFSKRFNEMSQLVVSEILSSNDTAQRVEKLEKWTTIANICKFLKNFNGVLQIMSAFASISVFRLKKTWEHLSKNSQQTIEMLQSLVSSDGRFRSLRDAMNKCDPPCVPYLGMYLMDLAFIEESTPDFVDGNLINFSKLRMISHIIRDIRNFQHSKYTIHHNRRVCEYLLYTNGLMSTDEAYSRSLSLEPRTSIMKRIDDQW